MTNLKAKISETDSYSESRLKCALRGIYNQYRDGVKRARRPIITQEIEISYRSFLDVYRSCCYDCRGDKEPLTATYCPEDDSVVIDFGTLQEHWVTRANDVVFDRSEEQTR